MAAWPAKSFAVREKTKSPEVPATVVLSSMGTMKLYVLFAPAVPAMDGPPVRTNRTVAGSTPVPTSITVARTVANWPAPSVGPVWPSVTMVMTGGFWSTVSETEGLARVFAP